MWWKTATANFGGTNVSCRPGVVHITSPAAFSAVGARLQAFLCRIAKVAEVARVEIDRHGGTATIYYTAGAVSLKPFLQRVAAALAETDQGAASSIAVPRRLLSADRTLLRLFRRGQGFSAWQVVHESRGRLRVRDVSMTDYPATVQRIGWELAVHPGIEEVSAGPLTGSLTIRFDPARTDRDSILARLDGLTEDGGLVRCRSLPSSGRWLFAGATLAVAVAGALVFPPLLPVSAVLLVASNIGTIRDAWRQMRRGHAGLPVLHAAIVGATLASGGYVAASLMHWLLLFWEDRRARLTAAGRQMLCSSLSRPAENAWVLREGAELRTAVANLRPGDVVAVREGDVVPVDGRIVSGTALLEEATIRSMSGLVCRSSGAEVFAGSYVVEGELRIEALCCGESTMATALDRTLAAVSGNETNSVAPAAPEFAERAVPPVLMTAGVGLLVGDAAVATAVLRPDYATGPEIGDSLALIERIESCLERGIVVRRPDVFAKMAEANLVLLDETSALKARVVQLEDVQAAAGYSVDEIFELAACGVRQLCDPRAGALLAAYDFYGRERLDAPVRYRSGGVEFSDRGRIVRVEGLAGSGPANAAPLRVLSDGKLAGCITFCEGATCAAAVAIRDLRACGMTVELLASALPSRSGSTAESLGVGDPRICPSDEFRAALIRRLRAEGHCVVYVGDCRKNLLAAAAANVAVFPAPDPSWKDDPSGVWLLEPDYQKLVDLRKITVVMRDEARAHRNLILVPNVACIAGALLLGFPSLAVVVLSNLGTLTIYSHGRDALSRTERRLQSRRQRRRIAGDTKRIAGPSRSPDLQEAIPR
jgi:Cu2+-exporting ATPase